MTIATVNNKELFVQEILENLRMYHPRLYRNLKAEGTLSQVAEARAKLGMETYSQMMDEVLENSMAQTNDQDKMNVGAQGRQQAIRTALNQAMDFSLYETTEPQEEL